MTRIMARSNDRRGPTLGRLDTRQLGEVPLAAVCVCVDLQRCGGLVV
jgi:hypothetical protein